MFGTHYHKCGFDAEAKRNGVAGCGFIWQHNPNNFDQYSSRENADAHTCPRCGKGGWYSKYNQFNCDLMGERYVDPDASSCTTWPPVYRDDDQRTASQSDPYSRHYEELVSLSERALLCLVRILGARREL